MREKISIKLGERERTKKKCVHSGSADIYKLTEGCKNFILPI